MDEFLGKWSRELDDLEVSMNMEDSELEQRFAQTQSKLEEWVKDAEHAWDQWQPSESAANIKSALESLRVQAALGSAEGKEALTNQRKELSKALNQFQQTWSTWSKDVGEASDGYAKEITEQVSAFQTQIDLMRVKFNLGKADANDQIDAEVKEIRQKIHEMKQRAQTAQGNSDEKWQSAKAELAESWEHLKSAIQKLLN
ncbi:hypothetical protein [Pontibacter sp. G13]|uniref:hypothetical protein n=1 Tax=Pontibacter sp. G13 TaxID=3074898 RepID=UPI00288AC44B|nr:hypothetical protein [Pontibacter sp. G13]WNJ17738.1 hypothetical protein RJD25_23040 [Pontibacter sp. G13]